MTRKRLRRVLIEVVAVYAVAIAVGIGLRKPFDVEASNAYGTYEDLLPLVIAIPAAFLAFCFQRRASYLRALRDLWSRMVDGISLALTYTQTESPSQERYLETLKALSAAIEEVRGVFVNIPAKNNPDGWYPFEPVKQIQREILGLGHGADATQEKRTSAHERIFAMWKANRVQLLAEFDREVPTHHHAIYATGQPDSGAKRDARSSAL